MYIVLIYIFVNEINFAKLFTILHKLGAFEFADKNELRIAMSFPYQIVWLGIREIINSKPY